MEFCGNREERPLRLHGWVGLALIAVMEAAIVARWDPLTMWATPACWWGYILLVDAWIERRTGFSRVRGLRDRLGRECFLSVLLWLVFEAYNLRLRNWAYVGVPEAWWQRYPGYLLAFSTILPGMFLTAEMLGVSDFWRRPRCRPWNVGPRLLRGWAWSGAACLVLPLLAPGWLTPYLFAPVWVGVFLALEPINFRAGRPSILRDLSTGRPGTLYRYLVAGTVCGLLWEFWNYWAAAKWHYTVPILPRWRVFEMPVAGYLGFGPFALEYYAFYYAVSGDRGEGSVAQEPAGSDERTLTTG